MLGLESRTGYNPVGDAFFCTRFELWREHCFRFRQVAVTTLIQQLHRISF